MSCIAGCIPTIVPGVTKTWLLKLNFMDKVRISILNQDQIRSSQWHSIQYLLRSQARKCDIFIMFDLLNVNAWEALSNRYHIDAKKQSKTFLLAIYSWQGKNQGGNFLVGQEHEARSYDGLNQFGFQSLVQICRTEVSEKKEKCR